MSKTISMVCALVTTFIWGTAFIAQDTGMDNIGPLTFNFARFFVGFFTILPIALFFEMRKINKEISLIKEEIELLDRSSIKTILFTFFTYFFV